MNINEAIQERGVDIFADHQTVWGAVKDSIAVRLWDDEGKLVQTKER